MTAPARFSSALFAIALGGLACNGGGGSTSDTDTDGGTDTGTADDTAVVDDTGVDESSGTGDDGPDLSEELFDPDHVVEVTIELAPADWDTLRHQTRGIGEVIFGEDCQAEPFASPFTYFPADVTVDGVFLPQTGVRKKGFIGSLHDEKPSLKLDFQEYLPDVTAHGVKRMTLNNGRQDPAMIRQCLVYQLFASAGLPSSRCNFAHVTVNDIDLGVYVNVEPVKKPMLRRHFDDDDGNLYEGTLSDFRDGWMGTFEQKTNKDMPDQSSLLRLATTLAGPDTDLVANLSEDLNVDQFIDFWAMEVLTAHWDGYASNTNNFFVYDDPTTGRLMFLPWGVDGVLGNTDAPHSVFASGLLARRLYADDAARAQYRTSLQAMLDSVWDEDALLAEIDRMEALILPIPGYAFDDDLPAAIDGVRAFVSGRRALLQPELDAAAPTWDEPLQDSFCIEPTGAVDMDFDTTWDTLDPPDPFGVGTASIVGEFFGQPLNIQATGSQAGPTFDPEDGDRVEFHVLGLLDTGDVVVYVLVMPEADFAVASVSVGFDDAYGVALIVDPAAPDDEFTVMGNLFGELTIDEAMMGSGLPVSGSFVGDVVDFGDG